MEQWLNPRLAEPRDIPELERLIPLSVRSLQSTYYTTEEMEGAMRAGVFGVDRQLIDDGTYFVVEANGVIVGCGGWSKRRSLFGSDTARTGEDPLLDPKHESARIRAYFVHPDFARRGIGRAILAACESAIRSAEFKTVELCATLPGEPFYLAFGYVGDERLEIPLGDGVGLPVVHMTKRLA